MTRKLNLLALLAAGAITVLAVAGLSDAASNAAPVNTGEPKVTGTAQVGETLTTSSGTWTSASTITYSYQWRRCNAQGNGCSNIGGADSSSYLVRAADQGDTLRAHVTAKNADQVGASLRVETAYGTKGIASLAAGKSSSQAFTTRVVNLEGGSAQVTATATIDGAPVTSTTTATYSGAACG